MRILVIAHSFNRGGAQRSLHEVVTYCRRMGDEILVLGPRSGFEAQRYLDDGVPVESIRLGSILARRGLLWRTKSFARMLLNVRAISRLIRRFHPDVVYTNTSSICAGAIAAKLNRTPHVWHVRENRTMMKVRYIVPWTAVVWMLRKSSAKVIFVSRLAMESFHAGNDGNAVVIHNGINPGRFADSHSGRTSYDDRKSRPGAPAIGFIGGMSHRKGVDTLLEAYAKAKESYPALRLELWGDGDESYTEQMKILAASLGIADSVRFMGYVNDVAKIYSAYDVVVIPSRGESFSRPALEAMAAGVPLIATRCGGPEEFVEDGVTGRLVPVDAPQELATALQWVLEDPLRAREMARRANEKVLRDFQLEGKLRDIRAVLLQAATR